MRTTQNDIKCRFNLLQLKVMLHESENFPLKKIDAQCLTRIGMICMWKMTEYHEIIWSSRKNGRELLAQ